MESYLLPGIGEYTPLEGQIGLTVLMEVNGNTATKVAEYRFICEACGDRLDPEEFERASGLCEPCELANQV